MNDFEPKVQYTPSQDKRFEISDDVFSRERIKAVNEAYKVLKEEVPFFAGVTVFGSLSKGKKLDETIANNDIDMVIFLDRDKYKETIEEFAAKTEGFVLEPMIAGINVPKEEIRQSGLEHGAEVYVVNRAKEIIMENTKNKSNSLFGGIKAANSYFISLNGNQSLFSYVESHDEMYELLKYYGTEKDLLFQYAAVFFLDVGGGLKKYRQSFIKSLSEQTPEKAEHLWGITLKAMKEWERKGKVPEKIEHFYPATFEDAKKYYGER